MTVTMAESTPHLEHDGETIWFCREACKTEYAAQLSGEPATPAEGRAAPRPSIRSAA